MPTPSSQLLKYADEVDVSVANQDVNLVDLDAYGHRVVVSVLTSVMNSAFSWSRAAGSARPVGHFADSDGSFQASLVSAMNTLYTDTDAVANKLSFDSSALTLNPDPRVREGGQVSANDLMMAYVLYKVYGSSFSPTEDIVFNLQDAYGMLASSDYASAIVAAFNNSESESGATGNEKGAVDAMFRDLLAADPLRFFDASGKQIPCLFEVNTDASGSGTWNLVQDDIIEVRTLFTFEHAVTLRTTLDVAQNLGNVPTQSNDETVYIAAGSTLSIRLQITASDTGASGTGGGATAPGVPLNVSATPGDAEIAMTWSAPASNGGSAITGYKVYRNGTLVTTTAAEPTSYTITGLNNGTSYSITIKAVNNAGTGLASSAVSSTPSAGGGGGGGGGSSTIPPGAPSSVSATPGDAQAAISWSVPASIGDSAITGYNVYNNGTLVTNTQSTSYTITGLSNGITNYVVINATNDAGEGSASSRVYYTPVTTSDGNQVTSVPRDFAVTAADGSASVSWSPPQFTGSGGVIVSYNIYLNGAMYASIDGTLTTATVTPLTNGTSYNIKMTALNIAGESSFTSTLPVTPAVPPPPATPANVTVTGADAQIIISWDSSTDTSITSYNIYGDAWGGFITSITPPENSFTFGATNGQTYTGFYVTAVNANGESVASATFSATPGPTSPPNTPTGLNTVLNGSTLIMTWTAPSGPSVQGYNIYLNGALYSSIAPTGYLEIPNLVPGLTYSLELAATNTIGESTKTSAVSLTPEPLPPTPVLSQMIPYNGGIFVAWLATGQTLSAYKVYFSTTGSFSSPTATVSGTTLSADIDLTGIAGFADGAGCYILITAVDTNGLESAKISQSSFGVTTNPIPTPPKPLTATPSNNAIDVTWSTPIYAGATPPILSYTLYVTNMTTGVTTPITGVTGLSATIPSLTNGTNYGINIGAVSADGESLISNYYYPTVYARPGTIPGPTTNVTTTPGDQSAAISWTAPSYTGASGGSISGYKVYVGTNAPVSVSAASTSYTATGLANGTNYNVTVTALSSDGESFNNGAQASVMPNVLPAAPSSVSVAGIDSALVMAWTPTANGATIASYNLYINGNLVTNIAAPSTSKLLRALANGTSYDVTISAVNNIGEGPQSTVTAGTPAPAAPGPVTVGGVLAAYVGAVPSTLTLGASVTAISATAFLNPVTGAAPTNLASIDLSSTNIAALPNNLFSGATALTSVSIPPTLTSIGSQTFNGCVNLPIIDLSTSSVQTIGPEAFQSCSALTSIILPASLTSINFGGGNTFQNCGNLRFVDFSATAITFLDGIFNGCSSLTSVLLPSGLLALGGAVFNGCPALTSVVIPSGVTSIGTNAFNGCTSLSSLTLPSGLLSLGDSVFNACSSLTSMVIPSGITSIGGWTFQGCAALTSITIPSGVTSIGQSAFNGAAITSVTLPAGLLSMGNRAFCNCASLTSVVIPAGITFLEEAMFYGCASLTSITLPAALTGFGAAVLEGCSPSLVVTIPASFDLTNWTANLAATGFTGTIVQA